MNSRKLIKFNDSILNEMWKNIRKLRRMPLRYAFVAEHKIPYYFIEFSQNKENL